ncbi:zinc-binding metallopeptidase family protein [Parvularcula marina]|uniref:Zinc-ribbon domain-containing protein n=1 Tax=Parvularcula marina TaxID=2292771 RepID=A0A371REL6_9PROT|nr:putative zinc-binding peptidase [Parvularcula marina]RFB03884.1 hypothetical protein DX908_00445 [Parvularcula marina]
MKRQNCPNCGNELHFRNTTCVVCRRQVGYAPLLGTMLAYDPDQEKWRKGDGKTQPYRPCSNQQHLACNWLVPVSDPEPLCVACRHNDTIPDLSDVIHLESWRALELAKRQLFYSILRWGLRAPTAAEAEEGALIFDFLADQIAPDGTVTPVLTGHDNGRITINVAEGDDAERERRRAQLGERYRTAVGHLRHEVGHYYWDRLIRDGGRVEAFRALFGDEQVDYAEALDRHYKEGPPADWRQRFISEYASSHPWEDWAESFAHYIHMVDGLETAQSYGFQVEGASLDFDPYHSGEIGVLIADWVQVTVAVNAVNRSMGQPDLYPFVLSTPVEEKLAFIHETIRQACGS